MIVQRKTIKFLLTIVCLWLSSCSEGGSDELNGSWAVFDVYYGNEDISGIKRNSKVILSTSMEIDNSNNVIFLPVNSDKTEYGYFEHYRKDGREWLKIYDSTDPRFNGKYLIHLKKGELINKGRNQRYTIELESKNVYIYGEKTVVSF